MPKTSDKVADPELDKGQTFVSHLLELRDRLMRAVLSILVIFIGLIYFARDIYTLLARPIRAVLPEGTSMVAIQVPSSIFAPIKLTLVASIFLAMPVILHQFWKFVAPGLYQHERRLAMPILASSVALFYAGAAFAYFVVFPLAFQFVIAFAPEGVSVTPDINYYLDFALTLFFAFGLAFEVPIATIVLVWAGATTPEKLRKARPYVIVGAFVIGMVLTPPDAISQTLLAIPMWLLFELGVVLSRFYMPKPAATEEVDEDRPLTDAELDEEFDRADREMDELAGRPRDEGPRDGDGRS